MRRVTAEIGTGAASLYRYLDNREDLLDQYSDILARILTGLLTTGPALA